MTKLEKDTDYLLRSIIDDKINFGLFTITYAARSMSLGVAMVILKQTNKQTKKKSVTFILTIQCGYTLMDINFIILVRKIRLLTSFDNSVLVSIILL